MKNKKGRSDLGFTMIELLAVIVLMGLLFAIAVPAVTKYIARSKNTSFSTALKTSYEAAENYMMSNDTNIILPVGGTETIELKTLTDQDYMDYIYDAAGNHSVCSDYADSKVVVKRVADSEGGLANYRYDVTIRCKDSGYFYYSFPNEGLLEPTYLAAEQYMYQNSLNTPQTITVPTLVSANLIKANDLKHSNGSSCNVNSSTVTVTTNGARRLFNVHLVCGAETLDAKFSV